MKAVTISDEMLLSARKKAAEMGKLNNSITNGIGNLVGFIGEEVALAVLSQQGYDAKAANTYDFDIIANGFTIDVKTKSTSAEPLPHYSCSVASFNTKQQCDYYAFVRVKKDLTMAWWCGVYSKNDFYRDSVFMKKGDIDTDNKYVVRADCHNLPISSLKETL